MHCAADDILEVGAPPARCSGTRTAVGVFRWRRGAEEEFDRGAGVVSAVRDGWAKRLADSECQKIFGLSGGRRATVRSARPTAHPRDRGDVRPVSALRRRVRTLPA
jgi:hypothetical protein